MERDDVECILVSLGTLVGFDAETDKKESALSAVMTPLLPSLTWPLEPPLSALVLEEHVLAEDLVLRLERAAPSIGVERGSYWYCYENNGPSTWTRAYIGADLPPLQSPSELEVATRVLERIPQPTLDDLRDADALLYGAKLWGRRTADICDRLATYVACHPVTTCADMGRRFRFLDRKRTTLSAAEQEELRSLTQHLTEQH